MIKKKSFCIFMAAALVLSMTACGDKEPTSVPEASVSVSTETPVVSSSEETPAIDEKTESSVEETITSTETSTEPETPAEPERETVHIDIYIVNTCGATIGGLAVIDPITGEQIDLPTAIEDNTSTTLSIDWPIDEQYFYMAVYNTDLYLVTETTIDFTGIQSMALITISGNGDLESIDAQIN